MNIQREQLIRFFFLAVFVYLFYEILHILSPFFPGILAAIVLVLIFSPLHGLIHKWVGTKRTNTAASLSTALVSILIVIPFILFSWLLLNEMTALVPQIKGLGGTLEHWSREGTGHQWREWLQVKLKGVVDLSQMNVQKMMTQMAGFFVDAVLSVGKRLPKNAFALVINLAGMIFTLFFLFRDGPYFFKWVKELVPMESKYKDQIANQLNLTVTAVVRGVFIVAAAQGTAAGFGFVISGVSSPLVLGFATMFTALIPLVGAGAVWLPVGIYYLAQGMTGKAIFLLLWGFLVVSTVDNFLRPVIIGNRAKLPMLFLFFGILGGLRVYGPMGIFLGPLVVALLMAFIKIYQEEYRKE